MMALGRRGIMGTILGAFAAGPKALEVAVEGMAAPLSAPLPMTGLASAAVASVAVPMPFSRPWAALPESLRKIYETARNRLSDDLEMERAIFDRCKSGFDPDIAVNISWSHAYKFHVQAERIRTHYMAERALRERIWG